MTATRRSRELIRIAIHTACREAGVKITPRPVIASEPSGPSVPEPEPLAALAAARSLERAARDAWRQHAKAAREDGRTWADIGEALGYADDPQPGMTSVAEHAFAALASDLGRGPSFGWTCPACLQTVLDYGPEMGHAEDAERGHAEGCARLAESARAYGAQWEDEGDG